MKKFIFSLIFILAFTLLYSQKYYSLLDREKTIKIESKKFEYNFSTDKIMKNSVEVTVEGNKLIDDINYNIDYQSGVIVFNKLLKPGTTLKICYKIYPSDLLLSHQKFKPQKYSNKSIAKINKSLLAKPAEFGSNDLFISGSKSFAVSLGDDEDLDLDQSLYLQIDGKLSDNISVKAQLSDNNSPITSTGTTKKITELDKMFIEVYSDNYSVSFGDFNTRISQTEFANYDFRAEGVKAKWIKKYDVMGAVAVSEGEFKSTAFYGKEGVQGPYYLPGNNSTRTKILTGTEKIFLNGNLLKRGSDYLINYNEGSIQFTNKHLITETSYIIADYEFTSEEYRNNIYFTRSVFPFADNKLQLYSTALFKNDDKNNPLNYSFTEDDIIILKNAGDNPDSARINGADSVNTGDGNYIKVDDHYEYVGFDSTGNYLIGFTFVGQGNGDYVQSGYYSYEWVGAGEGDYIAEIQLPLPKTRANYNMGVRCKIGDLTLNSEAMLTNYDKNSYSSIDDNNNVGYAVYNRIDVKTNLPADWFLKSNLNYKYVDKNFHSLARISSSEDEYETAGFQNKIDSLDLVKYGTQIDIAKEDFLLNKLSIYSQQRKTYSDMLSISNKFQYNQNAEIKFLPTFNYDLNKITQKNTTDTSKNEINRLLHDFSAEYGFKSISLGAGYLNKDFTNKNMTEIGNKQNKYFIQTGYQTNSINLKLEYKKETIDSFKNYEWKKYKDAYSFISRFNYFSDNITAEINYSHRENKFREGYNLKFDLLESSFSKRFFNGTIYNRISYNIGNEETYEKVKELIFVGERNGSYTYVDSVIVYEGPGEGDYEYEITSIGEAIPITMVGLNWTLNFNPKRSKIFENTFLQRIMQNLNFSSDITFKEESDFPDKIDLYLFKNFAIMNDNYTKYGYKKIKEQLWYSFKKNKIISHMWYEKTKKMDNRYENVFDELNSKKYYLGLNFYNMGNWNLKNNVSYEDKISNYNTEEFLKTKSIIVASDVGYKFGYNFIVSSQFNYTLEKGEKLNGDDDYRINSYLVEPNINWNSGGDYRLMLNFMLQNSNRTGSDYLSNILFSKRDGISTNLVVQFDYKFSKYITGYLNYNRIKYPQLKARNQLKMEVRADF